MLSIFRPMFLTLCFSLAFGLSAQAATKSSQAQVGIAAVVNDDIITYSDIENRLKLYLLGAPSQPPEDVRKRMVEQTFMRLVDESLQIQEAKSLGITVDPSEMEHALGNIAGQNNTTAEIFKERLRAAGVTPSTIEDQIRAELAWTQVVRRRLRPQITISEGEIDTELTRMERSSGKTEYRVAEIFISFDGPATEKNAREKLEAIAEEIRKGKPFSMLAREYSEAPGAATGGDLGWIEEGVLDSRLENALKTQRPGQLSAPIRADNGFHLLFLRDKRQKSFIAATATPAAPPPEAEPVKAAVPTEKRPALITTTDTPPDLPAAPPAPQSLRLKQIVLPIAPNEAEILVQTKLSRAESLRREIVSCENMDSAMQSFNAEGTGDLGDVTLGNLPEAMQNALRDLPPETLSPPVRNDKAITLLMICDPAAVRQAAKPLPIVNDAEAPATDPTTATNNNAGPTMPAAAPLSAAEQQREEVANRLGMQRLEQMAERYLRDLRATAYIDRRF